MADRQDIDALLIGALYGELDGDERDRLEAHLASHPQDRSALDGLRSTREILRDADLPTSLATAEPSPAISAMLLQEAARRAPARAAGGGILAYLAGLLRPFAASPALSAAAALVLVGGAAGLLYSRGAFNASEPVVHGPSAASGSGSATARLEAPTAPGAGGNIDDYRVALADPSGGDGMDDREQLDESAIVGAPADEATGEATGGKPGALDRDQVGRGERQTTRATGRKGGAGAGSAVAFQTASGDALAGKLDGAEGRAQRGYLELDKASKDQPTVLALDGERFADAVDEKERSNDDAAPVAGAVAKKAPARSAAPEPAPPPAQKPSAAPKQVARDDGKAGGAPAKAAALETWARDQHARMVKLVNAGKCIDAGAIGAEISRKAPDYYQANVANDRAVRACRSYVDRARRAKNEGAKSKAAAPRSPQPDSPYDAEMETVR